MVIWYFSCVVWLHGLHGVGCENMSNEYYSLKRTCYACVCVTPEYNGSCIDGICQESESHCDFCDEAYDEIKLNLTHPMNREGFCNCIAYDENNTYNFWHECEDDYYTGNYGN